VIFALHLPVLISAILPGAHFLRSGKIELMVLSLSAMALLLVRRRWAATLVQIVLVLGALEWLRTTLVVISMRQSVGAPWTRFAVILGAVTLFTLASALVFFTPRLSRRYVSERRSAGGAGDRQALTE
jgi:hypothetical protein